MIDELNKAIEAYHIKWHTLVAGRQDKAFFETLQPVAVGWKVAAREEYDQLRTELHDKCDMIVENWMNGRWIAKMILRDENLASGIKIVKIMQRRPNSTDAVGLDHLDFYSLEVEHAEAVLAKESNLKWSRESNDIISGYEWISLWFDDTEAKLKSSTVLDIVTAELQEINKEIIGNAA